MDVVRGCLLRGAAALGLIALLLPIAACRTSRLETSGTQVGVGQEMQGRLVPERPVQAFTFEGVASSLLDFSLVSDAGDLGAPTVTMHDPEGRPVELAPHVKTAIGAATMRVEGVVLLRSGIYRVEAQPGVGGAPVWYRFAYELRFPAVQALHMTLRPGAPQPVYVAAPRGGRVTVTVAPLRGSHTRPHFLGVEDPWGGRALEPSRVPQGAQPPMVFHGSQGELVLSFSAPIPGRYKVLAAARPGGEGPARIDATVVAPPTTSSAAVFHPGRPPVDYGLPAGVSGSASSDDP